MIQKKAAELRMLRSFCELNPMSASGFFWVTENPDFVLFTDTNKRVGIEITRNSPRKGSKAIHLDSIQNRVIEKAQEYFEQLCPNAGLAICLQWIPLSKVISYKEIDELAWYMANFVYSTYQDLSLNQTVLPPQSLKNDKICKYLREITIESNSMSITQSSRWIQTSSFCIPRPKQQLIENIVLEKESRLGTYHEKCDQVWLVIAANAAYISTMVNLEAPIHDIQIATKFDEVFLMDESDKQLISVKQR